MTTRPTAGRPRRVPWLRSIHVILLGAVVIALLLAAPIRIGPGDHERNTSCGNALRMDLGPWQHVEYYPDREFYLERAYRSCMNHRVDRVAQAVGVLTVTLLVATILTRRELRRSGEP